MDYFIKEFAVHGDPSGSLISIESLRDIPFEIKRVYYIYGTSAHAVRGRHSHRQLEQIIFCPMGSCDFILDDSAKKEVITMNEPNKALYIKGNVWREFTNFSPDCVVMVLASMYYDEGDYIRDYNAFLDEVKNASSSC
jgi:dTDP-4-dehydrorhamnose 3,5-epimerase-like enzyme